jgi:hypothetical protein
MPGGRPKRSCSLYGVPGAGHQEEQDVEEPAGRKEEPSSERLRSTRRLEFETLMTMPTTGDGGSGGGGDDDGGHDDGGPSSGLRKPYQRGPSTLPARRPLPHQRTVITPVAKT